MKPFDFDVAAGRAHVQRCRDGILAGTNAALVKGHAVRMTQSIFGTGTLSGRADQLPLPNAALFDSRRFVARTPEFDAALDGLFAEIERGFNAYPPDEFGENTSGECGLRCLFVWFIR